VAGSDRPVLTLAELEAFDPRAPVGGAVRRFCCPLPACAGKPRDAAHRALVLRVETGLWRCWRCETGGRLREHWPPRKGGRTDAGLARLWAQRDAGKPARMAGKDGAPRNAMQRSATRVVRPVRATNRPAASEAVERPACDWRAVYAAAQYLSGTPGARYLTGRGIPAQLAEAVGVRFTPRWYGRPAVLFPLHDRSGALVAVDGRYTDGRADPKSRSAGRKSAGVFATAGALTARPLVIVEGAIDALSLALCGAPALALCGKTAPGWLGMVCAFRVVAVALDGDAAGEAAAAKLASALLALGAAVERWRPSAGKDWNELLTCHGLAALAAALKAPAAGDCAACASW
jgi:hypothetical protein